MKKTIIATVILSAASFGLTGIAVAGEEFVTSCIENSGDAKTQGATDEQISAFCTCLDGEIGDNEAAIANLQEAAGDPSVISEENMAAFQTCSAQ